MYVDIDKAVAEALSLRLGMLEKRVDKIESTQNPGHTFRAAEDSIGSRDFAGVCQKTGFTQKQIQGHSRVGALQDARYEVCRSLLKGGLSVREVSRIMRRSCRSIQRMS